MDVEGFEAFQRGPREVERWALLTQYYRNRMAEAEILNDNAMYKFWKKQYWNAHNMHETSIRSFYGITSTTKDS